MDIETTDLSAVGSGVLLCACVRRWPTGKTLTYRIQYRDEWNPSEEGFLETEETQLLKDLIAELGQYDLMVGHNIDGFDLPFLRSRAKVRGIPFYLAPFTYDTMKAFGRVKFRTRLNRIGKPTKSMAMIADFLGLEQLKTAIYPQEWWLTVWGNSSQREEAMQNIIDHCKRDVRTNHEMYDILLADDAKASIRRWF